MIEKILNEVNRLKKELDGYSASEALDYIESYINTIPEEHNEDLEEEILCRWEDDPHTLWPKCLYSDFKNIAHHFAVWQKQKAMQDFLEKACEWLIKHNRGQLVTQFKNYMQDESEN